MNLDLVRKSDQLRYVLTGLRSAGVSMMYQDAGLTIRFAANLPETWPNATGVEGKTDDALFGEPQVSKILASKRQVIKTGQATKLQILRDADHTQNWYMLHIDPDIDASGNVIGVFTTILDINDLKYRETVLKTLLRELSHRSKNLLAIIQSIASQTARSSQDLDQFLLAFRNRVQAMAHSQDLVTASDWRGANLYALTRSQLQPLVGDVPHGFDIVGEDTFLLPNAALHLGLALHELAIDSLARGALGPAGGEIVLSANQLMNDRNEPVLIVTWTETFATTPEDVEAPQPSKNGFSGAVLGRIVPQALSASLLHETDAGQMIYQLTIPDTQYEVGTAHRTACRARPTSQLVPLPHYVQNGTSTTW